MSLLWLEITLEPGGCAVNCNVVLPRAEPCTINCIQVPSTDFSPSGLQLLKRMRRGGGEKTKQTIFRATNKFFIPERNDVGSRNWRQIHQWVVHGLKRFAFLVQNTDTGFYLLGQLDLKTVMKSARLAQLLLIPKTKQRGTSQ